MFNLIRSLFGKRRNTSKLYYIEINDDEINKRISSILLELQERIKLLREHLSASAINEKDEDLREMYSYIVRIKVEITTISDDVENIIQMELKNKDYFIIKDDSFLLDKRDQLRNIKNALQTFTDIIQQHPSAEELEMELISKMIDAINNIGIDINKVIRDDMNLRVIYKSVADM